MSFARDYQLKERPAGFVRRGQWQPREGETKPVPPSASSRQFLSNREKAVLSIAAGKAFTVFLGTEDGAFFLEGAPSCGLQTKAQQLTYWRHLQVKAATRDHADGMAEGLRMVRRSQFNLILAHFAALAGQEVAAFKAMMRDGAETGQAGRDEDSKEDVRQARAVLFSVLNSAADAFEGGAAGARAYAEAVSRKKHAGRTLMQLTVAELRGMVATVRNRAQDRRGAEGKANRNKKQRRGGSVV